MRRVNLITSILIAGLVGGLALASAACPGHAAGLKGPLGPLTSEAALGKSGSWTASIAKGAFVLSDPADVGAVRYYDIPWQGSAAKGRSIGVTVTIQGDGAAGLVFRHQPDGSGWDALVVNGGGQVTAYARTRGGIRKLAQKSIAGAGHGTLLQVSDHVGALTLFANGQVIGHVAAPAKGTAEGGVGVLAIGPGRFAFTGFAFGPLVAPHPAGMGNDRISLGGGGNDHLPMTHKAKSPPNQTPVPPPLPNQPSSAATTPPPLPNQPPAAPVSPSQGPPAGNAEAGQPQMDPLTATAVGAMVGVLSHVFGHYIIHEEKLPTAGNTDIMADDFSALFFIDGLKDNPDYAEPLLQATMSFYSHAVADPDAAHRIAWYRKHGPNRRRLARFMCLIYGAHPNLLQGMVDHAGLSKSIQRRCPAEEHRLHTVLEALLRVHRRKGADPVEPGDLAPSTSGHRMIVEYERPRNAEGRRFQAVFRRMGFFRSVARGVSKNYVLPRDTKLILRNCGRADVVFNPANGSITVCYEMMQAIMDTVQGGVGSGGAQSGGGMGNGTAPPPLPGAAGQSSNGGGGANSLRAYLVGTWRFERKGNQNQSVVTRLSDDGTYRSHDRVSMPSGPQSFDIEGSWRAQSEGNGRFEMTLDPARWRPKQFCLSRDHCVTMKPQKSTTDYEMVDHNTIRSAHGEGQRVR